ncbi:unnamed protein product [Ectocarpus sp. 8 AP-2014]
MPEGNVQHSNDGGEEPKENARRSPTACFGSALISSKIPPRCRGLDGEGGVILGIDEAGRGPVLGPMTYGAAYWSCADDREMSAKGFDDSKALTSDQRTSLFDRIDRTPEVGWVLRLISARELSDKMCRKVPYSLNVISHDAAAELIRAVQARGVKVTQVYVDTVGDPAFYQSKLEKEFGKGIKFVVAKKADSLYKTVSAASIVAKVTRDRIVGGWQWSEPNLDFSEDRNYGSGYPGDEKCKKWLESNVDPVFGFPDMCRFSWGTTKEILKGPTRKRVDWEEEPDEEATGMNSIASFMVQPKKKARANLFVKRGLELVDTF